MSIFDKFKKKNEIVKQKENQIIINEEYNKENFNLVEMNNYMLSDVRKETLSNNTYRLSLSKLSKISPITVSTTNNIKTIMEQNPKTSGNLYRITNLEDEMYLINNHKQVMDIKRTANKNMLFYKKEIKDALSKDKLFTTYNSMNSIIEDIQKKFEYYRLSLYIYSFSTFMEILLLGNYKNDYLLNKKNELEELDNEYSEAFDNALKYVKKNANKSLEGMYCQD